MALGIQRLWASARNWVLGTVAGRDSDGGARCGLVDSLAKWDAAVLGAKCALTASQQEEIEEKR